MTDTHATDADAKYKGERHKPVLLHEILDILDLKPGAVVVDCNLGDGGHSEAIIKKMKGNASILGFDLDAHAIARTAKYFADDAMLTVHSDSSDAKGLIPIQANFSSLDVELEKRGYGENTIDAVLFDLGLSTYDLIGSGKGFTFRNDEPLQMTFGAAQDYLFTAYDIVNGWAEEDIANVIFAYGEERLARKIAKTIVAAREIKPIETSKELADLIEKKFGTIARWSKGKLVGLQKTHPATKTFQALRIAVNNELEHLRKALEKALTVLKPGGKMAVIAYHSLEDRIVKQYFKQWAKDGLVTEITKKPMVPTDQEIESNPRSRSAKLRVIVKN